MFSWCPGVTGGVVARAAPSECSPCEMIYLFHKTLLVVWGNPNANLLWYIFSIWETQQFIYFFQLTYLRNWGHHLRCMFFLLKRMSFFDTHLSTKWSQEAGLTEGAWWWPAATRHFRGWSSKKVVPRTRTENEVDAYFLQYSLSVDMYGLKIDCELYFLLMLYIHSFAHIYIYIYTYIYIYIHMYRYNDIT